MARFTLLAVLTWAATFTSLVTAQSLPKLRIMPLGDSITKGSLSSDNTGYRQGLRKKLENAGATVDMIGSLHGGNMIDSDHEGHSGKTLRDIKEYYKLSIDARPNVVCMHAGTNNMDLEEDLDIAPQLFEDIIDGIWAKASEATILVAPVIWANDARMNRNTDAYNAKLKQIISDKQKAGKHILTVPITIGAGDLADRKHPNDGGYAKMAAAWYDAILEADSKGWIKNPVSVDESKLKGTGLGYDNVSNDVGAGNYGCQGGNWKKQLGIFNGVRVWEEVGTIMDAQSDGSRGNLILADLNGDGIADYILVDRKDGTVRAWLNGGEPKKWTSLGKINPKWPSDFTKGGIDIRFADVDNDQKADLIVVYSDGAARVWKNKDNGKSFESLDTKWASGLESNDKVQFKDIDGDGYADYVIVYGGGAVKWARNTHNNGKDDKKKNWETAEEIAPGVSGAPANSAHLYDLDGDGRADYVIIYDGGAVKALRNTVTNSGRNWDDLGTIAPGISGVTGDMIQFADMDGDGLADFLAVGEDGSIRMWKNLGLIDGIDNKGGSLRFADLNGDGKADIISVGKNGKANAWLNQGVDKWKSIGEIAPGIDDVTSAARVEFADVNGDGKADYLIIYGGGAVKAFLNNGNIPKSSKDDRIWQDGITIAPGVGQPGDKVRFADLNGDGYADYLIVFDGGAVDAYLNQKNIPPKDGGRIWGAGTTVATGVGEPGSKVRFADINGDGKAEYLIQYEGGAAKGFLNNGNIPKTSSERVWSNMGIIAGGVTNQGPVQYADINGDGKADYLIVFDDGKVDAYINTCDWKFKGDPNTGVGGGGSGDNPIGGGDGNGDNPIGQGDPRTTSAGSGGGNGDGDNPVGGGGTATRTSTKGNTVDPSVPTTTSSSDRGECVGPDCEEEDGDCSDPLCGTMGCTGEGCVNNRCVGDNCTPIGCIGPKCKNGKCTGSGCKTTGCLGEDCDPSGRCTGPKCIGIGCVGPDCDTPGGDGGGGGGGGKCTGPHCTITICTGVNCVKGVCLGSGCHPQGGKMGGGDNAPVPPSERPDGCETQTFKACNTYCTYKPKTSTCNTKCRDIEACTSPRDSSFSTSRPCTGVSMHTGTWDMDALIPTFAPIGSGSGGEDDEPGTGGGGGDGGDPNIGEGEPEGNTRVRFVMIGTTAGPVWYVIGETKTAPESDYCRASNIITTAEGTGDEEDYEFPTEIKWLNKEGECVYKGSTTKAGTLSCSGEKAYRCIQDKNWKTTKKCASSDRTFTPGVFCAHD